MKVSRCIALSLLIPLCGMAVLAVYLNAQEPVPLSRNPVPKLPDPDQPLFGQAGVGGDNQTRSGNRVQYYNYSATDPKTLQLIANEQAADREARGLAASYAQAANEGANDELRGNIKKQLKEKLAAIFEMQQKRRTAEIASIEERLARLKDVSKKRETNKDAIVDRRLEQMTGGVDELGWEERNRGAVRYPAADYIEPNNALNAYGTPVLRPDNIVPAAEPGIGSPVPTLPSPSK